MEKLTYTNPRGEKLTFGDSPFFLQTVGGLGDVSADIQTQKAPYQDGSTRLDAVFEERSIPIQFLIVKESYEEVILARQLLGRVLNPKLGTGVLRYESENIIREIDVSPDSVPLFPDGQGNRTIAIQKGFINLVAFNPYWRASEESVEQLVTFSGGLTFPLILPTIFGNQDSTAKSRIIVNQGDSPTPIEVTFTGPATSPIRIENETTGEFIEVAQSLLDGEKLWISTQFGKKRVQKIAVDGTVINAFNYIKINPIPSLSSTFFQLQEGNNLITYSTGEEYEKAPVTIRYYNRYLAV